MDNTIVKMWEGKGIETAYLFFDRSREALCEIRSEMDIRTRGTVNSRLANTLLLRARSAITTAAKSLPIVNS